MILKRHDKVIQKVIKGYGAGGNAVYKSMDPNLEISGILRDVVSISKS